jgi:hypothetical protein
MAINLNTLTYWQLIKLSLAIQWEIFSRYWVIWILLAVIFSMIFCLGYVLTSIAPIRR